MCMQPTEKSIFLEAQKRDRKLTENTSGDYEIFSVTESV